MRLDWMVAGAFALSAWIPVACGWYAPPPLRLRIYLALADPFFSGTMAVVLGLLGEGWLRAVDRPWRVWVRWGWLGFTAALALGWFATVRPPEVSVMRRFQEASLLALMFSVGVLAVFLPTAGLLSWRDGAAGLRRVASAWAPVAAYLFGAGMWLDAIVKLTPVVLDPVLYRMDLSFGFSPTEALFGWEIDRRWVRDVSRVAYPLLGFFLAAVAAVLQLRGAVGQLRRCLLACLLVGTLGLLCYRLAPAIGPIHAFPDLFQRWTLDPEAQGAVAGLRRAVVVGPAEMADHTGRLRNVMPSLHTAFALVGLAAAWSHRRRLFWLALPLGALQIATTLTFCVHYLVDLVAAVPFAAVCWWLADRLVRWRRGPELADLPALANPPEKRRARTIEFVAALGVAAGVLLAWGRLAPISPWLAWPAALVVAGWPAAVALRLNAQRSTSADYSVRASRSAWRFMVRRSRGSR